MWRWYDAGISIRFSLVLIAASAAVAACSGIPGASSSVQSVGHTPTPAPQTKIDHVVVIIQENRTVDNLFNGFPGADTSQTGLTHNGATVTLQPVSMTVPGDVCHTHPCWIKAYDSGKMDGFDLIRKDGGPTFNYAYVPRSETAPIWSIASKYAFGDRMFQSNSGPSFPAHQYLIAGQSNNADENPDGDRKKTPWGCDAPPGTLVELIKPPGTETYPCFDYQTLADTLNQRGVSWKYYSPAVGKPGGNWSAFDAVQHIRNSSQWTTNVISPETQVLADIASGNLAQVVWVVPSFRNSDHQGSRSSGGPQWVASVVSAIGASSYWSHTAIFIVWDDWGGWYDHVVPQQLDSMGLGFRVPFMVVSPYAKHGYVSHVQHEFGSIEKYIEITFGLPSLGQTDARADDLSDCFDYSQAPGPFVKPAGTRPASYFLSQPPDYQPPDT